ncbi:MAG: ATP-binding protein [Bradymonadia bacterium]
MQDDTDPAVTLVEERDHAHQMLKAQLERLNAENRRLKARLEALDSVGEGSISDLYSLDPILALAHLDQGIVIHRASDLAIVYANPAALRLLGLTLDQIQGRTTLDPNWRVIGEDGAEMPGEMHPSSRARTTQSLVEGVVMGVWRPLNHTRVWLKVNAQYVDDHRAPEPVVLVNFTDITNERRVTHRHSTFLEQSQVATVWLAHDPPIDPALPHADQLMQMLNGRVIEVNSKALDAFGQKDPQVVMNHALTDFLKGSLPSVQRWCSAFLRSKDHLDEVVTLEGAGPPKHFRLLATREMEGGLHARTACTFIDVGAEHSLTETRQMLTEVREMGRLGTITWQHAAPTAEVQWSPQIFKMLGYDAQTTPTHQHLLRRIYPEDRALVELILRPQSVQMECECRGTHPAGYEIFLRLRRIPDSSNRLMRLQCQDITARRRVEINLERSEALMREAESLARVGGWEMVVETGAVSWTPGVYAIYGLSHAEPLDADAVMTFYAPEGQSRLQEALSRCAQHGSSFDLQLPFQSQSTSPRWLRVIGTPVIEAGRVVRIRGVVQDITQQHLAEEGRRRLDSRIQALSKVESLELMAAGVAHDFKNHLTTLSLSAQAALLDLPRDSLAYETISLLLRQTQEAERLPRELMAYARRSNLTLEQLDLNCLISEVSALLEASVRGRAELSLDAAPEPLSVLGAAIQLKQVVFNLVINAIEAMHHDRGRVSLQLRAEEMSAAQLATVRQDCSLIPGRYAVLKVSDNGGGIPPEVMARMFDPFFTTKGSGNGLGLASVMATVRSHEGFVSVESIIGTGTEITVGLPLLDRVLRPR